MRLISVYFLLGGMSLLVKCENTVPCEHAANEKCPIQRGDIYIGGLVNIHRTTVVTDDSLTDGPIEEACSDPYDHGMFTSLSIIYAIEEINAGKFLDLKNVSLGYLLSDGCRSRSVALRGAADISTGLCSDIQDAPVAVVADTFSGSIGPVANYFQLTNTPVIAVWATSVEFTDTALYPTFFRTVPNDNHQADALIDIVESFNWTWVGAIATDENYGRLGIAHFKQEAKKRGICISYEKYLPTVLDSESVTKAVDVLMQNPDVKVIITFINSGFEVRKIFEECDRRNISKKIWIGTDVWIISRIFATNQYYNVIDAAFGTSIEEVRNEDFWNYFLSLTPNNTNINDWFNEFWETTFSCDLFGNQTSLIEECWSHSLKEKAAEFRTYIDFTTYNAVYAIGHAIANIINCTPSNSLLNDGLCPDVNNLEPWQLMQYLRNVNFSHHIKDRQFMFDENYEVLARYTVYYWKRTPRNTVKIEIIGDYDKSAEPGNYLKMNTSAILWDGGRSMKVPTAVCSLPCEPGTRKLHDTTQNICCFECVRCATNTISTTQSQSECYKCDDGSYSNDENTECLPKPLDVVKWSDAVAIGCLLWSCVGCILTFVTIGIFYVKRESDIVKSSSWDLSMTLQFGIVIGFLSPIFFLTPPTDAICQLRIALPSIIACILLAVFLIKIYMVIKIFNRGNKGKSMKNLKIRLKKFRLLIVSLIACFQICIVTVAYFTSPVKMVTDYTSSTKDTIISCDATIQIYIYNEFFNLILIIVCFVLAFRARKMPHNYHEARFISVVMTLWIIIFLVSIPTHLFTVGKLQPIIAVMFILILYTLILMMLFLPKCYLIFVTTRRRRRNSEITPTPSTRTSKNVTSSCDTLSSNRESGVVHDFSCIDSTNM